MKNPGNSSQALSDYIKESGQTQRQFAEWLGVKPQQITQWIAKGFIVVDGVLYSPRRDLK